ncbi:MAG TPA: RNA polymerase sigma factor [Puia sp.]|nr:RNA polymerase sigma factor [Puia sp.]
MNSLTDNALMLQVRSGDLDKMALLFQRYHRPLYGFLFHMTRHREASEDLLQNVFYRMLRSRHTFTGDGEFKTWMYSIARNVVKDHVKKSRREPDSYDAGELAERISVSTRTDETLEHRLELKALQRALNALSPESREVLILSRFQDLRYEEIAGVLDISVGAVKVRVHRAINQLKELYTETEQNKPKHGG